MTTKMTIDEMRAAVAKHDADEMAARSAELAEKMERIRAFNADPAVEAFKEKMATLDGLEGTEAHLSAIRIGLSGLGTLA